MAEHTSKPRLFDDDDNNGSGDGEDILSRKLDNIDSSSAVNLESLSIQEVLGESVPSTGYRKTSQQAGRKKVDAASDDPLLTAKDIEVKYEESLTIRPEDESRIVSVSCLINSYKLVTMKFLLSLRLNRPCPMHPRERPADHSTCKHTPLKF
jgi:hypothetical protein